MLRLIPHFAERLPSGTDRTRMQLEGLGVPAEQTGVRATVAVQVPPGATPGRRLCAASLIDYLVRLDPLVGAVLIEADDARGLLGDLPDRFPVQVDDREVPPAADVIVSVGNLGLRCDLMLDAAGWLSGVGEIVDTPDDGNPIGPLATAALGAGEVFKLLFQRRLPSLAFTQRLVPHRGIFSFFSYQYDRTSPPLTGVNIDAILVGAGGVAAGFLVALAQLEGRVSGSLTLVDDDRLDWDSLNRVMYAPHAAALAREMKIEVAARYLSSRAPALEVIKVPEQYLAFSHRIPARRDRLYPLVITALDKDEVRWQVQRDLPRTLVDAATGIDANCRIERIRFGTQGCLGCSRPPERGPVHLRPGEQCDFLPTPHAPSISFLSGFAGTLAAGEVIKLMTAPEAALGGFFDHVFLYPLHVEQRGAPDFRLDCPVDCRRRSVLNAYAAKWP